MLLSIVFVLVLAGALIYGGMRWRDYQRNPERTRERDRATRALFEAERRGRRG